MCFSKPQESEYVCVSVYPSVSMKGHVIRKINKYGDI